MAKAGEVDPARARSGCALPLVLLAIVVLKLSVALWAVDRGYEMGDEGFLLLNLNRPASSPGFFEFYKLLLLFEDPPRIGVVHARLLRIGVELLGSLVLVGGVYAWARRRVFAERAPAFSFVAFCLLGSFLSAASRSFSYTDATNLCVFSAAGGLFFLASRTREGRVGRGGALAACGVGFVSGFQVFVKFPSALALVPLVGLALGVLFRGLAARERVRLAGLAGLGLLSAVALFLAANGGLAPLVAKFRGAAAMGALAGYEPLGMLWRYVVFETWTAVSLCIAALVFAGWVWLRCGDRSPDRATSGGLWVAAAVLVVPVVLFHPPFTPAPLTYLAALLGFLCLALGVLWHRAWPHRGEPEGPGRAEAFLPLLLLLALPLAAFAGTNVPFALRLPSHVLPLFVAVAVPAWDLRRSLPRAHRTLVVLLVAVTCLVFVRNQVLEPYGLRRPVYEQTQPVEGLPVRVDYATARFLEGVASSLEEAGFRAGDPVIAFDYMPGLVFYLGGRSPGFPFYVFDNPWLNCFHLERAELDRTPFLVLGRPMSEAQRACIEAFDFPADFRLVQTLRFPYEEVYASFGGRGISHVSLYAPREASSSALGREAHEHTGGAQGGVEGDRE